jgi:hypothetical protein
MQKSISIQLFFSDKMQASFDTLKTTIAFRYAKKGYEVHQKNIITSTSNKNAIITKSEIKKTFDNTFNKLQQEGRLKDALSIAIIQLQAGQNLTIDNFSELKSLAAKYGIAISFDLYGFSNTKLSLLSYLFYEEEQRQIALQKNDSDEVYLDDYLLDYSFAGNCLGNLIFDDSFLLNSFNTDLFYGLAQTNDIKNIFTTTDYFNSKTENFSTQNKSSVCVLNKSFLDKYIMMNEEKPKENIQEKNFKNKRKVF